MIDLSHLGNYRFIGLYYDMSIYLANIISYKKHLAIIHTACKLLKYLHF